MGIDAGLPPPPQISPDGKYVWDGNQWQPIAGAAEASHGAIFPAWNQIQVEPSDPMAAPAQPAPVQAQVPMQAQVPEPVIDYSYTVNDPSITPLWRQEKSTGINKILYFGAALLVLVMAFQILNWLNVFNNLPWPATAANPQPSPAAASPTPDWSGPESVRADRFLNGALAPALAGLYKTHNALNQQCYKELSNSCFDAATATEQQVKNVLAVVKNGDIPRCIAAPMAKALMYMQLMDKQLQLALSAFKDNSRDELYTGVYRYWTYNNNMVENLNAVTQAQKAECLSIVLPTWVP